MSKNNFLTVSELINILKDMPQDAMVVVSNNDKYANGDYYISKDYVEHIKTDYYSPYGGDYCDIYEEDQVIIGTDYKYIADGEASR